MFNKISNRALLLFGLALALVWAALKWGERKTGGDTVQGSVMELDTGAVRSFSIRPKSLKHAELRFNRTPQGWTITDSNGVHPADHRIVRNTLSKFMSIRTLRLAGTMEKDAAKYQLSDTASTPITFVVNDGEPLTLHTGLVNTEYSQEGVTYVRLNDAQEIHAVAGMLTRHIDVPISNWRDHVLIGGDPMTWKSVGVALGGVTSYTLVRDTITVDTSALPAAEAPPLWRLNGEKTDPQRVQQFLGSLSKGNSSRYADSAQLDGLVPFYRLTITDNEAQPMIVEVFEVGTSLVLRNNRRPGNKFHLDSERDMQRLMRPINFLLGAPAQPAH